MRRVAACGAGGVVAAAAWYRNQRAQHCQAALPPQAEAPPRVLVTGFHDWKELDGNIWRCRDNPSCRLILGRQCQTPPVARDRGPLPRALRAAGVLDRADVAFVTLPTIWSTASGLDLTAFDIVVHMGLGVYDSHHTILFERDAYNMRRGADALGAAPPGHTLVAGGEQVQPSSPAMDERYAALGQAPPLTGDFSLREARGRPENSYICNETHHRALVAQRAAADSAGRAHDGHSREGRPRAVYFLHLPYARDDDHEELAAAVAAVIDRIIAYEERGREG